MSPARTLAMGRSLHQVRHALALSRQGYERRLRMTASPGEVFAWHGRPGAFERLTPPWEAVRVRGHQGGIHDGALVNLTVGHWPLKFNWDLAHCDYEEGLQFRDVQIKGPFKEWTHLHRVEPVGDPALPDELTCEMIDQITYSLPLNGLTNFFVGQHFRRRLDQMFAYRHRVLADDLRLHEKFAGRPRLKVLISGSTGLVGRALVALLTTGGHKVIRLVRRADPSMGTQVVWDPAARVIDSSAMEGLDVVVHLAGENIASSRWSSSQKEKIQRSRVEGTNFLCETLDGLECPPHTLICASATGYYGDRGDEVLDEHSSSGKGFLPEVCREWEAASMLARESGIRVVNMRIGVVLTPLGGMLGRLLMPFLLGLGGPVGSGRQVMSWIALDDLLGMIYHCMMDPSAHGPVNAVAPHPVTNHMMTRTLAHVLRRPAVIPMPAGLLRLILGQMADELLLSSARVLPCQAMALGYEFRFPHLDKALKYCLGRNA